MRLLKLVRGEWRGVEELIDGMARIAIRNFSTRRICRGSHNGWRSSCRRSPATTSAAISSRARGALLAPRHARIDRRVRRAATGIRPAIVESFEDRKVWVLGPGSRLNSRPSLRRSTRTAWWYPTRTWKSMLPRRDRPRRGRRIGPLAGVPARGAALLRRRLWVLRGRRRVRVQHAGRCRKSAASSIARSPRIPISIVLRRARMRVGLQARLGIDSIVAGPPAPMDLSGTVLGLDSYLGEEQGAGPVGRLGTRDHLGHDTIIG